MKRDYIFIAVLLAILFTVAFVYPYGQNKKGGSEVTVSLFESDASTLVTNSYDVVVVGGGAGGMAAALQAARMGMRVIILEETDLIGGQINPVPNMDGGSTPGSGTGIYKEFIDRVSTYYATTGRFPEAKSIGTCYWQNLTKCFEPKVGREIMLSMLSSAGVTVKTGVKIQAVNKSGNVVTGVSLSDGSTYQGKIVMDATEYGDLMPLAGVKYRIGNVVGGEPYGDNACVQDITYAVPIKQYSTIPEALLIKNKPPGYDANLNSYRAVVTREGEKSWSGKLPVNFLVHNAYRGIPDSTNPKNYVASLTGEGITKTMINWANDYPDSNLSIKYIEDKNYRQTANCEAKLKTIGFIYYLQTELGMKNWSIATDEGFNTTLNQANLCANIPSELKEIEKQFPPIPYVRESRRLLVKDTLTGSEILRVGTPLSAVTKFADSLAVGDYPNDLHGCDSDSNLEVSLGDSASQITPGGLFQVPFTAFIPESVDGFLVASKSLGVSRIVNGATRLQPIEMAIGQAAGALAAKAILQGQQPRFVKPFVVQDILLTAGVSLAATYFNDVPYGNPRWADVQLTNIYGIMNGVGGGNFGVANKLSRADASIVISRLFNIPTYTPSAPTFTDVPTSHYAYSYVEGFFKKGIAAGCSSFPARFCPDGSITKSQLAVFVSKAAGLSMIGEPKIVFSDISIADPFAKFASAAVGAGYLEPCSPGAFCPNQEVNRGDIAHMVANVLRIRYK